MMNGSILELSWIEIILIPESPPDAKDLVNESIQGLAQLGIEPVHPLDQIEQQQVPIYELRRDQAEVLLGLHSGRIDSS